MIEVEAYTSTRTGDWEYIASAECEDEESVLLAARTLWDEAHTGLQGCRRQLRFYVDGNELTTQRRETRP